MLGGGGICLQLGAMHQRLYMKPNWLDGRLMSRRFSITDELAHGRRWELLFGKPGSTFPVLHWDVKHYHAFICQLYGRKAVVAFPPDQTRYLYPKLDTPNQSQIPVGQDFDPDDFPKLREATGASATLGPGDMLFIPSGWWHAVENTSISYRGDVQFGQPVQLARCGA